MEANLSTRGLRRACIRSTRRKLVTGRRLISCGQRTSAFASFQAAGTMANLSPRPYHSYDPEQERLDAGPSDLLEDTIDRFEIFMPAVQSLVNALGGYEELETSPGKYETIYRPGDSVLAVLKDLKRLWRKDDTDDERTVARCMARAGLLKELLALLVECTDRGDWGKKVALVACESGPQGGMAVGADSRQVI